MDFHLSCAPVEDYLQALAKDEDLAPDVVDHRVFEPKSGKTIAADRILSPPTAQVLARAGINSLYTHQAGGICLARRGRNPVLATPTASGKSLVYNSVFLESWFDDPSSRALYLFPLKALAQDQFKGLQSLFESLPERSRPTAATYDGDTTASVRSKIRRRPPNVICTNPEMLHLSFLAHHASWKEFLSDLRLVVVDEVHTYRGVMGSNMAWVFRRLLRLCRLYGSRPVFIFCSATMADPADLCSSLTGLPVRAVTKAGSPSSRKHFLMLNGQGRTNSRALRLLRSALHRGIRTIVYTQSRKMAELISLWAGSKDKEFSRLVSSYRAGFLPIDRRKIEDRLSSGELLAVVSTSALELGIDVGDLELCLLVGYPGSIMATWQRSGRVGRNGQAVCATVFIAQEDPLDQYFMRHPQHFFDLPPESAVINHLNPSIMAGHLLCAAAELPLNAGEDVLDSPEAKKCLKDLLGQGLMLETEPGGEYLARHRRPQQEVDLRGSGVRFCIHDAQSGELMGEIDRYRAWRETHPGAVYVHLGKTYVIQKLDTEQQTVLAEAGHVSYYTRPLTTKQTRLVRVLDHREVGSTRVFLGRLQITECVSGFERRHVRSGKFLGREDLDLPPLEFETEGLWIVIPASLKSQVEERMLHFMGGIHALEHALIAMMPLTVLADRNDLGGISIPMHEQLGQAAVFVYDGIPGGAGLTREAFTRVEELLCRTAEAVAQCECRYGCPSCVHSPKCGSGNRPLDKAAALMLLEGLHKPSHAVHVETVRAPEIVENRFDPPPAPGKRFGVLDLETRRSAQEVGGWHRARAMGVSCAVLYDSGTDGFTSYLQEDMERLVADLQTLDLVVGFNILRFDYQVLQGYSNFRFRDLPTLDILEKVRERLGYRLSLAHLAGQTLQAAKSADGLQALKWWKQGRIGEIIEYCTQDVRVTRDLYIFGRDRGYLVFQNKAGQKVRLPVSW